MYVNQFYRGPRRGRRLVQYFDDLQDAQLDLTADRAVLRLRTEEGHINLSLGLDELQRLTTAIAHPVDATTVNFDFVERRPPATAAAPPSAWVRLVTDEIIDPSEETPS